jgi:uncharacterized membrane protein YbhN (UPF0104 family)
MLKRVGQIVIMFLTAYFIGALIVQQWERIATALSAAQPGWLVLGALCFVVSFFWLTVLWRRLVAWYGVRVSITEAWYGYSRANIVRYIPGNIWGLAAKTLLMTRLGLRRTEAVFVMIYESAVLLTMGLLVYFFTAASSVGSLVINVVLGIITALLLALVVRPQLLVNLARWFGREASWRVVPWSLFLRLAGGYVVYWLVVGLGFFAVSQAFLPWSASLLGVAIGVYAVSWSIGFMSLLTPSGVGVREISMVFFLAGVVGSGLAAALAVAARLIFVIGEVLSFVLVLIIRNTKTHQRL